MNRSTSEQITPTPIDLDDLQRRIAQLDEEARRALWLCVVAFESNHTIAKDGAR